MVKDWKHHFDLLLDQVLLALKLLEFMRLWDVGVVGGSFFFPSFFPPIAIIHNIAELYIQV